MHSEGRTYACPFSSWIRGLPKLGMNAFQPAVIVDLMRGKVRGMGGIIMGATDSNVQLSHEQLGQK